MLTELSQPFECPDLDALDLAALRTAFSELMDQAAAAAHAAGLEQDDCTLERFAELRGPGGAAHHVRIEHLSGRDACIHDIRRQWLEASGLTAAAIVAVAIRIQRERRPDPFGFDGPLCRQTGA